MALHSEDLRMTRRLWALALLVPACYQPAGLIGDSSTGIAVEVRRGPIMPVEQEGVDNTAPVPGARVIVATVSGGLIREVVTDSAGRATVVVPAGEYQLVASTCPGAMQVPPPLSVRVVPDSLTPARLVCDTGIR